MKSENDEILYYEGGIPNKSIYDLEMQQAWSSVPQSIVKFYEKLHNGFYYVPSRAMGLVPLERVTYFKEDEWGILDDLDDPLEINLDTTRASSAHLFEVKSFRKSYFYCSC
ncbi:hypothetical protein ACLHDF_20770 [Priestia aryabhattai]